MIVDARLERKHVKCVVVGDPKVGKTSLVFAVVNKELPTEEQKAEPPTVHRKVIYLKNHRYEVEIYDTNTDEKRRITSYADADVVVLCFATSDYRSFRKTRNDWALEIRANCPQKPFIVVGTKTDIREELRDPNDVDFITDEKAKRVAERLGANYYIGCSATQMVNVDYVFEQAVTATREIPRCLDKSDVKGAGQTIVDTITASLPKPDLSAFTAYTPMEFSRRCTPVFKQTFINIRECWRNPQAFSSTKRKMAYIFPCLSTCIPIEEEEDKRHFYIETPPAIVPSEETVQRTRSDEDSIRVTKSELDLDTKSLLDRTNQSGRDTFERTVKLEDQEERENMDNAELGAKKSNADLVIKPSKDRTGEAKENVAEKTAPKANDKEKAQSATNCLIQ